MKKNVLVLAFSGLLALTGACSGGDDTGTTVDGVTDTSLDITSTTLAP